MRFCSVDEIVDIRTMRGFNIPWPIVAKKLKATILECRTAIGLPTYSTPVRQAMPWDQQQQTLPFDK